MSVPLYTLLLVAAMCLSTGLAQECNCGYREYPSYPGSRYKVYPFLVSWKVASDLCQFDGEGSQLVVINSDEEAEVVRSMVQGLVGKALPYTWMGLNDRLAKGHFYTEQGVPVSETGYDKWYPPGKPNLGTGTDCVYVNIDGLYRAGSCLNALYFICERPNA